MGRHRNYGGAGPTVPFPVEAMIQARFQITAAQFKNLAAAPHFLLGPPGSGRAYVPMFSLWSIRLGTVGYTAGSTLSYAWGAAGTQLVSEAIESPALTGVVNGSVSHPSYDPATGMVAAPAGNDQPLYLACPGANFATGDGVVELTVFYAIASVP